MSDLYSGIDLFGEFDRLQRQISGLFGGLPSSIRSGNSGAFPQINIGATDDSIEIVAFAPGINAGAIELSIDKGLLTIAGERLPARPEVKRDGPDGRTREDVRTYAQERFTGAFRRVIELPQNADPDRVQARYTNGCLLITVGKREASKPRVITVQ